MGVGDVPLIAERLSASGVVAAGELADPIGAVAGHLGDPVRRMPLSQQPDNLPVTPFRPVAGPPIARLQLLDRQMWRQLDLATHALFYNHIA